MLVSATEPFFVPLRWISEFQATPQRRQLGSGLSPHRLRFNPRPVCVEFVVQKVALLIFPCQYYSTNAPHSFIHLTITVIRRATGYSLWPFRHQETLDRNDFAFFWVMLTPSGSHTPVQQAAVAPAPNDTAWHPRGQLSSTYNIL
jgi:hypothetical protein